MQEYKKMTFGLFLLAVMMESMWGVSFVSTKVLLTAGLNPSQIYIMRFGIAYLCLLLITRTHLKFGNWKDELLFLLCGMAGGSMYFITENTAIQHTLVSNVGLIISVCPLLTAILTKIFFRHEIIRRSIIIGSLIAFVGVAFVIYNSSFKLEISPVGDLLALLGALSWSVYSIALKRFEDGRYPIMVVTRKVFFYGIVTSIPFAFVLHSDISPAIFTDFKVIANILFLGLGASMSSFLIWNYLVKKVGALNISNFLYLGPIITLVSSAVFLGERITVIGYIGCALILSGVILGEKLKI